MVRGMINDFILSLSRPHTTEREEKYKCLTSSVVKIKTHYTGEIQYFSFHESFCRVHWVDFTIFSTKNIENGYPVHQIRLGACFQGAWWILNFLCCHPRAERRFRKRGTFLHCWLGTGRVTKAPLRKALHSRRRKGTVV